MTSSHKLKTCGFSEQISKYECPFSHLEKECGHELHGPEGYQDVYSVWCMVLNLY